MTFSCMLPLMLAVVVQPLASEDVLELSVLNEVDHALNIAPETTVGDDNGALLQCFPTNSMTKTQIAIKLVSEQRPDGRWIVGTNDCTSAAVEILNEMTDRSNELPVDRVHTTRNSGK